MATLKLRKVGSSGDQVYAHANSDGVHLTPYDPDFDAAMEAFGRTRRKYRNALRKLAK
jgi:hypothetical protein